MAALGTTPVYGTRHDAHASAASGLTNTLADFHTVTDPGYLGDDSIDVALIRKPQGVDLHENQAKFNTQLSNTWAAVEHLAAHLKTSRMFSEEGGRYRCPIHK